MAAKSRVSRIDILHNRCKGCEICVALCPRNVLALKRAKAVVVNLDACIGCDLCELRCPDFAITVVHEAEPHEQEG